MSKKSEKSDGFTRVFLVGEKEVWGFRGSAQNERRLVLKMGGVGVWVLGVRLRLKGVVTTTNPLSRFFIL